MAPPSFLLALADAGMRSPYQQLKGQILSVVGLSKDAVHIYIGLGCFLFSVLVLRFAPTQYRALILGFLFSLGMEALDLRDNVKYRETTRALASLHDLVNTNLLAYLTVVALRLRLGAPAKTPKRTKAAK
ncbi:MAG TPA: hypothetical protein VGS57_21315 [Thermoanaerobaculia bacterium]|jgi:hypothetical protein|nr:hypothetical protein [Thermoanaerobaculia bacterium]